MPSQRHYARQYREELKRLYIQHMEEAGERAAAQLARILENLIKRTLRFSSQFGTTGFRDARVQITTDVRANENGLAIRLNALVVNGSGEPHFVWHIIAFGRKRFRQRRTSPPIRARLAKRTAENSLEVQRFPGYRKNDVFVIQAGTIVEGIPARKWYELAAREFPNRINFPTIRTLNLRVVRHRIEKPRF
jgi:hypothetical protein